MSAVSSSSPRLASEAKAVSAADAHRKSSTMLGVVPPKASTIAAASVSRLPVRAAVAAPSAAARPSRDGAPHADDAISAEEARVLYGKMSRHTGHAENQYRCERADLGNARLERQPRCEGRIQSAGDLYGIGSGGERDAHSFGYRHSLRERAVRGSHKSGVDEIAGRGTSDDVNARDEGPRPRASVMLSGCQRSYDGMEPCSYQFYKLVALVNLGFGEFTVLGSRVGGGNDSSFHVRPLILNVAIDDAKNQVVETSAKREPGYFICRVDGNDPRQDIVRKSHTEESRDLVRRNSLFERKHRPWGTKCTYQHGSVYKRLRFYKSVQLRHKLRAIERALGDGIENPASSLDRRSIDDNGAGLRKSLRLGSSDRIKRRRSQTNDRGEGRDEKTAHHVYHPPIRASLVVILPLFGASVK